jgi:hypothetical protein
VGFVAICEGMLDAVPAAGALFSQHVRACERGGTMPLPHHCSELMASHFLAATRTEVRRPRNHQKPGQVSAARSRLLNG